MVSKIVSTIEQPSKKRPSEENSSHDVSGINALLVTMPGMKLKELFKNNGIGWLAGELSPACVTNGSSWRQGTNQRQSGKPIKIARQIVKAWIILASHRSGMCSQLFSERESAKISIVCIV